VKYVVLIYNNPATWEAMSEEERDRLMGEFDAFDKELIESGEFIGGAAQVPADELVASDPGDEQPPQHDDTLTLLFLCCHPALSPASQVALTLRAVGGLTTAQIARAFLVPEATLAQRISRAKQRIRASGIPFRMPPETERANRLRVVLHVLYLIFNEGYTATSGPDLQRSELTAEAIRLSRALHRLLPDDGEVAGLLALMRRNGRGDRCGDG
jgi:predicted RNA polymerase sigma factor